jgi:hypothetical protein
VHGQVELKAGSGDAFDGTEKEAVPHSDTLPWARIAGLERRQGAGAAGRESNICWMKYSGRPVLRDSELHGCAWRDRGLPGSEQLRQDDDPAASSWSRFGACPEPPSACLRRGAPLVFDEAAVPLVTSLRLDE